MALLSARLTSVPWSRPKERARAPVLASSAARVLCSKADVLIHHAGAVVNPADGATVDRGSVVDQVIDLAREAAVKTVVLFDYDPDAADSDVDRMLARAHRRAETGGGSALNLRAAAEGASLDV
jgi:hypothetical protein